MVLIGFWLGIVNIASNMAYDLQAHYGNFWLDSGQMDNPKGYWDSVSDRVQPALGQLDMTKVPNDFIWSDGESMSYPQR
ncbi:MAG: hypothetical protein GY725_10555, partial [bacterium]|nr:hypothetical protein [bacterium]